jgi:adhesin/invasin
LTPFGFLFRAEHDSPTVEQQSLYVTNVGGGSLTYDLQASTESGGNWLSLSHTTGTTDAGTTPIEVTADSTGLPPGSYHGKVTATFSNGTLLEADVVFVITAAGCLPETANLISTSVGKGAAMRISFPRSMSVQVVDNCGNALDDATSTVTIRKVESIPLKWTGDGSYKTLWTPSETGTSVEIGFTATSPSLGTFLKTYLVSMIANDGPWPPRLLAKGVVEAAGYTPMQPLAPGGLITIFGAFGCTEQAVATLPLPRELGGCRVKIQNESIPLFYAGPRQINAQVPTHLQPGTEVQVKVTRQSIGVPEETASESYLIAPTQPGVFLAGDYAAALDGRSILIRAENPARIGDTLQVYATGLGATDPSAESGVGAPGFTTLLNPVKVTLGGVEVPVLYQGLVPGYVGLYQINIVLTAGVPIGEAVPLAVYQNGVRSNPGLPAALPILP